MRIALAFLVVLVTVSPVHAESRERAATVVEALGVEPVTAARLVDVVAAYDRQLDKLSRVRSALKRRLLNARYDVDFVLDDAIANQHAIAHNEEQLITRVRMLLPAKQAAQLLVLLAATELDRTGDAPVPRAGGTPRPRVHDPDALFPPRSQRPQCNPYESMHGCRY